MKKKLRPALLFIVLMGVVSLFSDMTHESASSIRGAYLALLGASASTIGFVSGLGELIGYGLRLFFGRLADKSHRYWSYTLAGYALDLLAVPALALVHENGWAAACALLLLERAGKAMKKPAKNTLVSFAASQEGAGRSFALEEALDQIGAFLGPVFLFLVMLGRQGDPLGACRRGFAFLLAPALIALFLLVYTSQRFPTPQDFETGKKGGEKFAINRPFRFYLLSICLFAFGFMDFSLITMHVARQQFFPESSLPLLYAAAMAVDAVAALFFGRLYDRRGFSALAISGGLAAFFAPLVFGSCSPLPVILGILLWGIGMGAQESTLKAAVAAIAPKQVRASAYGVFELAFGFSWFFGSWALGALYDASRPLMILVSMLPQLLAVPLYLMAERTIRNPGPKRAQPQ